MDAWIGSMIGGGVGAVVGHVANHFISWIKENRQSSPERRFICAEIIFILEEYADKCAKVAQDFGQPYGKMGVYEPVTITPEPVDYSLVKGNWRAIDSKTMYTICSLPILQKKSLEKMDLIAEYKSFPPEDTEYFEARQYEFSVLGLKAAKLAMDIRADNSFPDTDLTEFTIPTMEQVVKKHNSRKK